MIVHLKSVSQAKNIIIQGLHFYQDYEFGLRFLQFPKQCRNQSSRWSPRLRCGLDGGNPAFSIGNFD
ncbi:hypothetical protein Hanom_Chr08g00734751 [Helianthus anomalus]